MIPTTITVPAPADNQEINIQCAGNQFIDIQSASYGANCNGQYGFLHTYMSLSYYKAFIKARESLQTHCNGKLSCNYKITMDKFGGDPSLHCMKEYKYQYRCAVPDQICYHELNEPSDNYVPYIVCPSNTKLNLIQATYGQNCYGVTADKMNKLTDLTNLCNSYISSGHSGCKFTINPNSLGGDPKQDCSKKFKYGYKCAQFPISSDMGKLTGKVDGEANGEQFDITCSDKEFIDVITASYGLNCGVDPQSMTNAKARVNLQTQCNGRSTCTYTISSATFGSDPAPHCAKDYNYEYRCAAPDMTYSHTIEPPAEDMESYITCPTDKNLNIIEATYGDNLIVNHNNKLNYLVQNVCYNQNTGCKFTVDPNMMGDPAPNLPKNFKYAYKCAVISPTPVVMINPVHTIAAPADNQEITIQCVGNQFIDIQLASFGANCPASQNTGNVNTPGTPAHQRAFIYARQSLQTHCNGKYFCSYQITLDKFGGDPSPGCSKEYKYQYRCAELDQLYHHEIDAPSDGYSPYIDCPQNTKLNLIEVKYGHNCGGVNPADTNKLSEATNTCEGQKLAALWSGCLITVDPMLLGGDPKSTCSKNFRYWYKCELLHTGKVGGEADNKQVDITCNDHKFIDVISASYGTNCGVDIHSTTNAKARVNLQTACNGKSNCTYTITSATFGSDPAIGCQKDYDYEYRCAVLDQIYSHTIKEPAHDWESHIICPANTQFNIIQATYGFKWGSTYFNNQLDYLVQNVCNNQNTACKFTVDPAANKMGDPIPNSPKDFKYVYKCSVIPTNSPTVSPTKLPTTSPSQSPTLAPSIPPSASPSLSPTLLPTIQPTINTTISPTLSPTFNTTIFSPSASPLMVTSASNQTSASNVSQPISSPTSDPTAAPTLVPTLSPTMSTSFPTIDPVTLSSDTRALPALSPTNRPIMMYPTSTPVFEQTIPTMQPTLLLSQNVSTESETGVSGGTIAAIVIGVLNLVVIMTIAYLYKTGYFNDNSQSAGENSAEKEPLNSEHRKQDVDRKEELSTSDPGSPPPFDPSEYDHFGDEFLDLHLEDPG